MPGYNIIGIAVDITNGFLEKWDFNYSGVVGKPIPVGENSRGNAFRAENPPVLKMFVVSSNATTNSTYVNSKEFPKLGYIPSIPTIQIGKWKDLRLEEAVIADSGNRSHKDWIFYIELTSTDAPHFQAVTTDNCGKLMLVTIDDNPLFPVFISDPIANGNLRIEMTNEATMEIAKEVFGKMVMKGMGSVLEK